MIRNPAIAAVVLAGLATAAQRADRAGFARFPVVVDDHELYETMRERGRSASATVYRGGTRIGQGEVVAWTRGKRCWYGEFRGFVGKGSVALGPLRLTDAATARVPEVRLDGQPFDWQPADGGRYPRWRGVAPAPGLTVSCDFYRVSAERFELRLWCETVAGFDPGAAIELLVSLPGRRVCVWFSNAAEVETARGSAAIRCPPGFLRAGDSLNVVLSSERHPVRVQPSDAALAGLGLWLGRRRHRDGWERRVTLETRRLLVGRPRTGIDLGDFVRRERPRVWTHNEFDLTFGLATRALATGDPLLARAARDGAVHTLARDLAPSSGSGHAGLRLPVRHGPVHGRGPVDSGHVFLEGCLLVGWLEADRLLFEHGARVVDDLAELVDRKPGFTRLRDAGWPLANLELATSFLDRRPWQATSDRLLAKLAKHWDEQLGFLAFRESRRGAHARVQDLWLVSGLLLPALRRASLRGSEGAKDLIARLTSAIRELPRAGGRLATHYWWTAERGWQPSTHADPCCEAWVVEGLHTGAELRDLVARQTNGLVARLPGDGWDPATRLALLLRLSWLSARK